MAGCICSTGIKASSDNALVEHGIGNFKETSHVGAFHVVHIAFLVFSIFHTGAMDAAHDVMQALVNLFHWPAHFHGILRHFKSRCRDTACVHRFTRGEEDLVFQEMFNSFGRAGHVRTFGNTKHSVANQVLGIFLAKFVLCCTRQSNVALHFPWTFALVELGAGEFIGIRFNDILIRSPEFEEIVDLFAADSVGIINITVGT